MQLAQVSLTDKFEKDSGHVYLNGSQALLRLTLMQRRRDLASGLNTAGFVSGYRGSPLHSLDLEFQKVPEMLAEHHIKFLPAINEDLAATAVRGSQMAGIYDNKLNYDGVFSFWYGKSPGLDRSIDAIRHANLCGTSKNGGVLAIIGDDHGMRSTDTMAHCEATCEDLMMPLLYPANIQEVLDLGLMGIELSRFCGAWVGFKIVPETVECSSIVAVDPGRVEIVRPEFKFPQGGVHVRPNDFWFLGWDQRLVRHKIPAAVAFARANKLNHVTHTSNRPRLGIVAAGKAWLDVTEALRSLGINESEMDRLGITVYKVGMVWPHDIEGYKGFASGLEEVLVVEEKREQIEGAIKNACYSLPDEDRPRVVGRFDEKGQRLINELRELTPEIIARAIAARIQTILPEGTVPASVGQRLAVLDAQIAATGSLEPMTMGRLPFFCSGCPHNTSNIVPEGSRVHAGIGCHGMSWLVGRADDELHMGGEGINWVGEAPFVDTDHVFQNLGDGTYFHSGSLAIRQAVAAKVNITYKILFNDAVAMTGGQVHDGDLNVANIARQVRAEGVEKIVVVTDEPEKYDSKSGLDAAISIHHRREIQPLQEQLRNVKGVSVLIYDQACAAEKRRKRKRGQLPDPAVRIFINDRVCEGCGDCGKKSNCLSVVPLETEYGRKRAIEQSSCNKDYSCVEGFCPSFVRVEGGNIKKGTGAGDTIRQLPPLPEPAPVAILPGDAYRILIAGVGGTGVVTVGALIGMAARLEGKYASVLDTLGLAQKGGAVISHLRIAQSQDELGAVRVNTASADLLIACDSLVAAGDVVLDGVRPGHTHAVINSHETMTGAFAQNPDLQFPSGIIATRLRQLVGEDNCRFIEAHRVALRLLGDSIAANILLLGYCWQQGLIPLSEKALLRAIELNGVAVDWNKQAFQWGRRCAHDPDAVEALIRSSSDFADQDLDALINSRAADLTDYQDEAYAQRYRELVKIARDAEAECIPGSDSLAMAVARYGYKLMAYKDEYEVARLHSDPAFREKLAQQFEGDYKLKFYLAPPLIARKDPATGIPRKIKFGAWMMPVFTVLAKLRFLRGSAFDPFGYTAERKLERTLINDYEQQIVELAAQLTAETHKSAVELAELPEKIRGFGHVKQQHISAIRARSEELRAIFAN